RYPFAVAAGARGSAETDRHRAAADAGARQRARDIEAAVATAAANRLRDDAGRVARAREHAARSGERDGERRTGLSAVTADAAPAAQSHRDAAAADARARQAAGDVEAAIAATPADRLRDESRRTAH